jgi:hypothetical protein
VLYYVVEASQECADTHALSYSPRVAADPRGVPFWNSIFYLHASDTLCDSVQIIWHYSWAVGSDVADSFVVLRGGMEIGRVAASDDIVAWGSFTDHPPSHDYYLYQIFFWNRGCGETPSNMMEVGRSRYCPDSAPLTSNIVPHALFIRPFPNPFNPITTIEYAVPGRDLVTLAIFDLTGRRVALLVDGTLNSGTYRYTFDGSRLPSGIYFARLQGSGFVRTQKLVLLK